MASRMIFLPTDKIKSELFEERLIDFEWVPGMAVSQGTRSVLNLHQSVLEQQGISRILEISTRSQTHLGIALSAFNLPIEVDSKISTVEVAYQASKVFENGGPYSDLLQVNSLQAKTDARLKSSGNLVGYSQEGILWPLVDSPNFYDYLYIMALLNSSHKSEVASFEAFSDIAYSQNTELKKVKKSFNCQARSAAIYVSLTRRMEEGKILSFLKDSAQIERDAAGQIELF